MHVHQLGGCLEQFLAQFWQKTQMYLRYYVDTSGKDISVQQILDICACGSPQRAMWTISDPFLAKFLMCQHYCVSRRATMLLLTH